MSSKRKFKDHPTMIIDISDFDAEMFDVVTSIEVIEHINNPNIVLKVVLYLY